ncbi:MAG: phage protein Gp36 family protein [Bacteroidales bacterium]
MFIEPKELTSAIYEYQLNEITENDPDIVMLAISAAVEEMKSYLNPNHQKHWNDGRSRFDVDAIFGATGAGRNPLVLQMCKTIAVYHITQLSNVDMLHEKVQERYDRAIDWLEKVAGIGKYAGAPGINPGLPVIEVTEEDAKQPFRYGSREKFNHE